MRHVEPLLGQIDRLAADVGLGLTHVTIQGHRMATDNDIFAAMQLDKSRSLIGFDSNASRTRIEQLPWVAQAHIRRSFPHRVDVIIRERRPFAVWQNAGREFLVDETGQVLTAVRPGHIRSLPVISGKGAPAAAREIVDAVARWPDLVLAVANSRRVHDRRWTLQLADDRLVLLPEAGVGDVLSDMMRGERGQRVFDQPALAIDLRIPGRAVLHPGLTKGVGSGRITVKKTRTLAHSTRAAEG